MSDEDLLKGILEGENTPPDLRSLADVLLRALARISTADGNARVNDRNYDRLASRVEKIEKDAVLGA